MLIINADDYGRLAAETDAVLRCYRGGRITMLALARSGDVELMTHPIVKAEEDYLFSDEFSGILRCLAVGSYALV
jgi:hypothetical protein